MVTENVFNSLQRFDVISYFWIEFYYVHGDQPIIILGFINDFLDLIWFHSTFNPAPCTVQDFKIKHRDIKTYMYGIFCVLNEIDHLLNAL